MPATSSPRPTSPSTPPNTTVATASTTPTTSNATPTPVPSHTAPPNTGLVSSSGKILDVSEINLNEVLYGADPTERVVAVETLETTATLFIRDAADTLSTRHVPLSPWLITDREQSFPGAEQIRLTGDGYNVLHRFRAWSAFL